MCVRYRMATQVFELPHEWINTILKDNKKEYRGFNMGWSKYDAEEKRDIALKNGVNVILQIFDVL